MSNTYPTSTTSVRPSPSRRKWFVDFQLRKNDRLILSTNDTNLSTTNNNNNNNNLLLMPIGYSEQRVSDLLTHEDDERLLARRSWDIALQPIKQLPMNVILAWMAGNTFSLMSIMIVVMLFMKPIQVKKRIFENKRILSFLPRPYFLLVQHLHHWNKKVLSEIFGYIKSCTFWGI